MFCVDDVDLIVKQLAEDLVAQLRAFQPARRPAFDENPEHIWLPFDPVPGKGDRTARLVLQLEATPQVSHHQSDNLSVFARSRRINFHGPIGAPAEGVFQVVREDPDDDLHSLSGLVKFEIRDADVNLVGSGEWGVGSGERGMRNVQGFCAKYDRREDQKSPSNSTNQHSLLSILYSPLSITHSPLPIHFVPDTSKT